MAPGLVRVICAVDHHAMVVRADHYSRVMRALVGYGKGAPSSIRFSDLKMSGMLREIAAYAAFPNLAWQAYSFSSNHQRVMSTYRRDGRQSTESQAVKGLEEEMRRCGERQMGKGVLFFGGPAAWKSARQDAGHGRRDAGAPRGLIWKIVA